MTLTLGKRDYAIRRPTSVKPVELTDLVVARVSGLCSDGMADFSTRLPRLLEDLQSAEDYLGQLRQALIDQLHRFIHHSPSAVRRALLDVKRDLFNGRTLTSHSNLTTWSFVEAAAGSLANEFLRLEAKVSDQRANYIAGHANAINTHHQAIVRYLDNPLFRCGLAVANRTVAAETGRLRSSKTEEYGRRERKLAGTLLRYISRASLKLSPFSTFTPVGLCEVTSGNEPLSLVGGSRNVHSLVRLRRHILDRCVDLLCFYEPWRRTLGVRLNDSIAQLPDGRTLHRAPSQYQVDEAGEGLVFRQEALIRASFHTETAQRLRAILAQGAVTYGELLSSLEVGCNEKARASLKKEVDRLIEVGFATLSLPWSGDEGHLEKTLLNHFRLHSGDLELRDLAEALGRIVELEDTLLTHPHPVGSLFHLQSAVDRFVRSVAKLRELPHDTMTLLPNLEREVYQDVWSRSEGRPHGAIVRVGPRHLQRAQESLDPWLRFNRLYDRKIDLLFSIGSTLRQVRGPGAEVGMLEAFDLTKALFRDFVAHEAKLRTPTDCFHWRWNPLGLPVLDELSRIRESARERLADCIDEGEESDSICIGRLSQLLATIPSKFKRNQGGACVFLQPADAEGSMWVLNRLKEGTGRMSSRYTPLMPESLRSAYTEEIAKRSFVLDEDERLLLLDIHCVSGDTLNVHAPQTQKVLVLPGTELEIGPARCLRLSDLLLSVNEDGWPRLRDRSGQGYLTAYIGIAGATYLPTFVKFLCAFGPTDTTLQNPPPRQFGSDPVTKTRRLVIGNVVLLRNTWQVKTETLRRLLKEPETPEAFERLHRFVRLNCIPRELFVKESKQSFPRGTYRKPQYLDLSSPLFVAMLESVTRSTDETITFVEALPRPQDLPTDSEGRRWAVELLADSVGLSNSTGEADSASCRFDEVPFASTAHGVEAFL